MIRFTPEAPYTEEARKNNLSGVVKLRVVLAADGLVKRVSPVTRLSYGLTENAERNAASVGFLPATKDGRAVSQYATLSYSFMMY